MVSQVGTPRRPAVVGSFAFLLEAVFMALVPFLGGTVGACAALVAFGALNGFGNVMTITAFQRWAPAAMLGRLMGVLLLTSFGVFPVSVAVAAIAVHHFGPAPIFPVAGAALAVAIVRALTAELERVWNQWSRSPRGPRGMTTPPIGKGHLWT